jgi:hypothetical protein
MRTATWVLTAALVFASSGAYGQQATEMHIPIGKSPGLSGKVTYIGQVGKTDAEARTVADSTGGWTATVTARTRIWLDRSSIKQPNREGTFADLVAGRVMEIKYEGKEKVKSGPAEWIKVEVKS